MSTTADTKDWAWVLDRACADRGLDPAVQTLADLRRASQD